MAILAQGRVEDFLGVSPRSANSNNQTVFKSATGEWRRSGVASSSGLDCAVNFSSKAGGVVLIGPTPDGSKGTILFIGTKLVPVKTMNETMVALLTDLDLSNRAMQPVKAFQLAGEQAGVAIATDMAATLRGMTDIKRVALNHNGNVVFELAIDGVFAARDALAQCMGLPAITTGR